MPPAPAWQREKLVLHLAGLVLDAVEKRAKEGKSVEDAWVRLNEKSCPQVYRNPSSEDTEFQWRLIEQMAEAGWICISYGRGDKHAPHYAKSPKIGLLNEEAVRAASGRTVAIGPSWAERFVAEATKLLNPQHPAVEMLTRAPLKLEAYGPEEVAKRLVGLRELATAPLLLREVSSKLFWGQSKVLDRRAELVAAVLDVAECPFSEMPVLLNVHLPDISVGGVLFVENLTSFEQLARNRSPDIASFALAYAQGFKASAGRLRRAGGASLYFSSATVETAANAQAFSRWLRDDAPALPAYFFGDLDYSGMSILARLREGFPQLTAWQPGYAKLLERLQGGDGHSPEAANKAGQRDPVQTGCTYSDEVLLPALREHGLFVDQE